jgi:translation initiation factor IF-1
MQTTRVIEGILLESLPNALFRVKVTDPKFAEMADQVLLCHVAGRMRRQHIRILPGDRVKFEMTQYDVDRGRIVFKLK